MFRIGTEGDPEARLAGRAARAAIAAIIDGEKPEAMPGERRKTLRPMHQSAAVPMHLARLIGEVPNQLSSLGSSDQAMHLLAREGSEFLVNRCALVFVFAPTKLDGDSGPPTARRPWNWVDLPPISFSAGTR